jgi:hypothetical protein
MRSRFTLTLMATQGRQRRTSSRDRVAGGVARAIGTLRAIGRKAVGSAMWRRYRGQSEEHVRRPSVGDKDGRSQRRLHSRPSWEVSALSGKGSKRAAGEPAVPSYRPSRAVKAHVVGRRYHVDTTRTFGPFSPVFTRTILETLGGPP